MSQVQIALAVLARLLIAFRSQPEALVHGQRAAGHASANVRGDQPQMS